MAVGVGDGVAVGVGVGVGVGDGVGVDVGVGKTGTLVAADAPESLEPTGSLTWRWSTATVASAVKLWSEDWVQVTDQVTVGTLVAPVVGTDVS